MICVKLEEWNMVLVKRSISIIAIIASYLGCVGCLSQKPSSVSDDFVEFKRKNLLKNSTEIKFQTILSAIQYDGVEYDLSDLEQYNIISTKFNKQPFTNSSTSPLWKKEINGTLLLVIKDDKDQIKHASIIKNDNRVDFVAINDKDGHPAYATISLGDYDDERLNSMTKNHKDAFKYSIESDNKAKLDSSTLIVPTQKTDHCTNFRIIEVAIAYDATLCKNFDYRKDQTDRHIQGIIGLASQFYEPMCLKLEISYLEGYCDERQDPFQDIVRSSSILERFTTLWRTERASVKRDVAHLLTGNNFEQGVLGYAFKATMCTTRNAFGANYITWSDNIALQAALFAHELGHNAGADHFGSDCSNWLMAPCGNGLGGFSDTSKKAVMEYVGKQDCLASEVVLPQPTTEFDVSNPERFDDNFIPSFGGNNPAGIISSSNPNQRYYGQRNPPYIPEYYNEQDNANFYGGYFNEPNNSPTNHNVKSQELVKLHSKAVDTKCLTLRIINTNLASHNPERKVELKTCQNSSKQVWKINSETSYIHSAHDESLCLVPKLESHGSEIYGREKKRTRLTVDICPYVRAKQFQWHFTKSGLVVNEKKDVNGIPLIMQASRGLNKEQRAVLLIPTLSRFSNSINDFFRWSIVPIQE